MKRKMNLLQMVTPSQPSGEGSEKPKKMSRLERLAYNILDSAIVGGISALSAYIANPSMGAHGFLVGFSLAFLIKLKEFRGL